MSYKPVCAEGHKPQNEERDFLESTSGLCVRRDGFIRPAQNKS
jgi:hypothetical protein